MKQINLLEKWKTVLESELGDEIPTTGFAILVAMSLELQTIEELFSNRIPEAALPYSQYFRAMVRRCSSIIGNYKWENKEINSIAVTSPADDLIIKRDIFKLPINEIHASMTPFAKLNLTETIKEYEPYIALGDTYKNLVGNKIIAFVVNSMIPSYAIWFLRCEKEGDDTYIYIMSESI